MLDDQYQGPRGTFTVDEVDMQDGGLRLKGRMRWSIYGAVITVFTVVAILGLCVLIYGDGSGDSHVLGWSTMLLFGVMAVGGWCIYPRQIDYQQTQLSRALLAVMKPPHESPQGQSPS